MTAEEWAALPEDVDGDLVDGLLVEDEIASYLHETIFRCTSKALLGRPLADGFGCRRAS
jgi:hypothetical protein